MEQKRGDVPLAMQMPGWCWRDFNELAKRLRHTRMDLMNIALSVYGWCVNETCVLQNELVLEGDGKREPFTLEQTHPPFPWIPEGYLQVRWVLAAVHVDKLQALVQTASLQSTEQLLATAALNLVRIASQVQAGKTLVSMDEERKTARELSVAFFTQLRKT